MITNQDDVIYINDIYDELETLGELELQMNTDYNDGTIGEDELTHFYFTDGKQARVLRHLLSELELIGRADERCIIRDDVVARGLLTDHMLEVNFDGVLYLV